MAEAVADATTTTTTTADQAVADSTALAAAASAETASTETQQTSVVPEKYDLKLPDGSTVDPAVVQRTEAIARDLGLSNEAGQKLLDRTVKEISDLETSAKKAAEDSQKALIDAWKPGGTEWVKRETQWATQAKADPELGATPEAFAVSVEKAQQALAKYGPELKPLLDETGYGSHPLFIRMLARIGRGMSEGSMVMGSGGRVGASKTAEQLFYPGHYDENGRPKPTTP